jgi:hypothetical protein
MEVPFEEASIENPIQNGTNPERNILPAIPFS